MSIVYCPKCKSPNDDKLLDGSWLACSICNNRWFPSAATIDSLPTSEIPQSKPKVRPSPPHIPAIPGVIPHSNPRTNPCTNSGEYLPDDPESISIAKLALTERVEGRQSGQQPALRSTPILAAETREAKPKPPPRARQAAHNPETGPTIDSDLFDRLEGEARYNRSEMKTVPEIVYDDPAKYRTSVPHSDHSSQVACPVCGHSYVSSGTHHVCPQCGTAYDEDTNVVTASPGSKDDLIGRTLRGCLIDRKLGEGGMGAVYHAKQLSLDRSVAVKVLPVDLARNKNFIQRFEREAKSLARLNHPNILQIYDFGDDPQLGLYFMIIEYVEGLDLGEVLNRRGLLGQIEVLDLLRQSVMGLEAAAEKGVIHRDIKPDNLMISGNGLVKVSDFGLAKGYVAQVGVTAAGVRVGTPAFMSPEQCDGVEVDFRSDIYNLGATAFLCLTGRLPFDGETPFAIMLKHKTEAVPSLCEIDPTIHRDVDALIKRLLAKKPAERCEGLRELIEDIEALETDLAGTDSVLRKSKGPFRALINGGASPRELAPRHRHSSETVPLLDRVEVVDLPAVPPGIATAQGHRSSSSASGRRAATGNHRRTRGSGMRAVLPPTPLEIATPPVVEKVGGKASRRLDTELQQARERGRRSQLDLTVASGDRLAESGQIAEAAREWLAAAELAHGDPGLQADLRRRASQAARRSGITKAIRRFAIFCVCLMVAVGMVYVGTPFTHNFLVKQRLTVLLSGLDTVNVPRRIVSLREFSHSNSQPWDWYVTAFKRAYTVPAATEAEQEAMRLESLPIALIGSPTDPSKSANGPAEIAAVTAQAQNPAVPWETVAKQASDLLLAVRSQQRETPAFAPVIEAGRRAEAELSAQRGDFERVEKARADGNHGKALELAGAYRTRHPRSLSLSRLPLPALVRVETPALELSPDTELLVDGVAVQLEVAAPSANGWPAKTAKVCRSGERDTVLDLRGSGFVSVRQNISGSTVIGERQVPLMLRQAPAWMVAYADPGAAGVFVPWAALHPLAGGLLIQHHDGLLILRPADGAVAARVERAVTSPAFGSLWFPQGPNRLLIAQDDGSVQLFGAATLIPEQTVHRGKGAVVAWADLDLALQNSRRIHVAVERTANGCQLVAQDGDREYWRYAHLKAATQQPQIIQHDDRLYVIDDQALHLLEEDGKIVKVFALPANRVGPLVELPANGARRDVLIPTVAGIQRLQFASHQDPVRAIGDPVLAQIGPGLVVTDGDLAFIVSDRSAALVKFAPSATVLWRQEQMRPVGAAPVLTSAFAITVDDLGTLLVRERVSGKSLQRLVHGTPVVGQPIVIDIAGQAAVVVCDRAGQTAAYVIKR